jgi:hypothetical protein
MDEKNKKTDGNERKVKDHKLSYIFLSVSAHEIVHSFITQCPISCK